MDKYMQLCGALGMLKTHGVGLNWSALNEMMRQFAVRLHGALFTDPVHTKLAEEHRRYRHMCLSLKLIRAGELFDEHDCVPLI